MNGAFWRFPRSGGFIFGLYELHALALTMRGRAADAKPKPGKSWDPVDFIWGGALLEQFR